MFGGAAHTSETYIIGEIRPLVADDVDPTTGVRPLIYRIFNGAEWVKFDHPSVNDVWDLLGYDDAMRNAMREFYGP